MKHARHHTDRNTLSWTSENLLDAVKFLRDMRDQPKSFKPETVVDRANLATAFANVAAALIDLSDLMTLDEVRPLHSYNDDEIRRYRALLSFAQSLA